MKKLIAFILKHETEAYFLLLTTVLCFVVLWRSGEETFRLDRNLVVLYENQQILKNLMLQTVPGTDLEWASFSEKVGEMYYEVNALRTKLDNALSVKPKPEAAAALIERAKLVAVELEVVAKKAAAKLIEEANKKK